MNTENMDAALDQESNSPIEYLEFILKYLMPSYLIKANLLKMKLIDIFSHQKTRILAGSQAEGLDAPDHFQCGSQTLIKSADVDILIVINNTFLDNTGTPGTMYCIKNADGLQPNYAFLEPTASFEEFHRKHGVELTKLSNLVLKGVGILLANCKNGKLEYQPEFSIHGPALTADIGQYRSQRDNDQVFVFEFKGWPDVAKEWGDRHRPSGWPCRDVRREILNSGFNMAGVGRRDSPTRIYEWRYSFNNAEKILARSLNLNQRQLYVYIKLLRKQFWDKPDGLSSYVIKTLFFWICERVNENCFHTSNLPKMLLLVLDEILTALSTGIHKNYFISGVNMLEQIPLDDLKALYKNVMHVRRNPITCLLTLDEKIDFVMTVRPKLSVLCQEMLTSMQSGMCDTDSVRINILFSLKRLFSSYLYWISNFNRTTPDEDVKFSGINITVPMASEILQHFEAVRQFSRDRVQTRLLNITDLENILENTQDPFVVAYLLLAVCYLRENKGSLESVEQKALEVLTELETIDEKKTLLFHVRAEIANLVRRNVILDVAEVDWAHILEEVG